MAINGNIINTCVSFDQFKDYENQIVSIKGYVHRIREMTGFAFILIRTSSEVIQCVYAPEFSSYRLDPTLTEESCVKVTGKVVSSTDAKGNLRFELQIHDIEVLSKPAELLPIVINKKQHVKNSVQNNLTSYILRDFSK